MKNVSKSQLKQWLDQKEDMALIDVLPKDSFQKQHIPGAINISLMDSADFASEVEQRVKSKDQRIVVYCASTQCDASQKAAQKLEDAGFTNVYRFEEGVQGWFGTSSGQAAA